VGFHDVVEEVPAVAEVVQAAVESVSTESAAGDSGLDHAGCPERCHIHQFDSVLLVEEVHAVDVGADAVDDDGDAPWVAAVAEKGAVAVMAVREEGQDS